MASFFRTSYVNLGVPERLMVGGWGHFRTPRHVIHRQGELVYATDQPMHSAQTMSYQDTKQQTVIKMGSMKYVVMIEVHGHTPCQYREQKAIGNTA